MKNLMLIFVSIILLSSVRVSSQKKADLEEARSCEITLNKNRPTIYLAFERYGNYESPCGERIRPGIWLKLSNNTGWAIYIDGFPVRDYPSNITTITLKNDIQVRGVRDGTEMRLLYDLEGVSMTRTKVEQGRVLLATPVEIELPKQSKYCSQKWMGGEVGRNRGFWIASGNSILFSVPKDFLTERLRVNIQYNYEWESADGQIKDFEPHHLAFFYGSNLPKSD